MPQVFGTRKKQLIVWLDYVGLTRRAVKNCQNF
jgi:hypothetical protein